MTNQTYNKHRCNIDRSKIIDSFVNLRLKYCHILRIREQICVIQFKITACLLMMEMLPLTHVPYCMNYPVSSSIYFDSACTTIFIPSYLYFGCVMNSQQQ